MSSPKVTPGTASAFGGVTDSLISLGVPVACAADGPSGIRMEGGYSATQMPIGTLLASTWNPELTEELYTLEGKEMYANQVDTLLGPGMNIHRHPLNGRNFEYFSEDPYLTGCFAAAAVRGINRYTYSDQTFRDEQSGNRAFRREQRGIRACPSGNLSERI